MHQHTPTAKKITRHVLRLPKGKVFSIRDLLAYGKRSAVDSAVRYMVKLGRLIRVARGVLMRPGRQLKSITPEEVAQIKAAAFGKLILPCSRKEAQSLKLIDDCPRVKGKEITFETNGPTSSFLFGTLRIHFRKAGPRRLKLGTTKVGNYLRAFWAAGLAIINAKNIDEIVRFTLRQREEELLPAARFMPFWLRDRFDIPIPYTHWATIQPSQKASA